MKHILIMETGSFKVIGGAAKDTYKIYQKLILKKKYDVDIFADMSKIDPSIKTVSKRDIMLKNYDLIWLNSIRDVDVADEYKRAHPGYKTKFMYVDRGNVLLNFENADLKKFLPKMMARRYLVSKMQSWLDYYIAISADQYSYAKKFFTKRTDVRYIMIAPHDEFKILSSKRTFNGALSVSRLDERQKKVSFMIKGIEKLKEKHEEMWNLEVLKIVGTGVDEESYKKLSKSLGLERNIRFKGFVTGKPLIEQYNDATFFVSTSEWEGLGRSLLEAMACGLPLLINDRINTVLKEKPLQRLVKDGYNGIIYEYDNVDDFAEKFYRLYKNKKLQKRLSDNTKKFMKQFSFANVISKYEEIINESS